MESESPAKAGYSGRGCPGGPLMGEYPGHTAIGHQRQEPLPVTSPADSLPEACGAQNSDGDSPKCLLRSGRKSFVIKTCLKKTFTPKALWGWGQVITAPVTPGFSQAHSCSKRTPASLHPHRQDLGLTLCTGRLALKLDLRSEDRALNTPPHKTKAHRQTQTPATSPAATAIAGLRTPAFLPAALSPTTSRGRYPPGLLSRRLESAA